MSEFRLTPLRLEVLDALERHCWHTALDVSVALGRYLIGVQQTLGLLAHEGYVEVSFLILGNGQTGYRLTALGEMAVKP